MLKPLLTTAALLACLPALAAAEKAMLRVNCDVDDADSAVYINGVFKGECPVDISLDAGTVSIKVIKPQDAETERVFEREVRLAGGTAKRVEVVLGAAQPSERAALRAKEQARESQRNTERITQLGKARTEVELAKLRKLAGSSDSSAMVALANLLAEGKVVTKDDEQSLQWHQKAAQAGNPEGMYWLGMRYASGRGVPEDSKIAFDWYLKAAEAGSLEAMGAVASRYSSGIGVAKDAAAAAKWAEKSGDAPRGLATRAWLLISPLPLKGPYSEAQQRDLDRALPLVTRAAEGGQPWALAFLGNVEISGLYDQPKQAAAGIAHLDKAIALGDWYPQSRSDALYYLAAAHLNGLGPDGVKNPGKGRSLMTSAAELGDADAMRYLGVSALNGEGVPTNYEQALFWLTKCAKLNNGECAFGLGLMHLKGHGTPSNRTVAVEWLRKGEKLGSDGAAKTLRGLGL